MGTDMKIRALLAPESGGSGGGHPIRSNAKKEGGPQQLRKQLRVLHVEDMLQVAKTVKRILRDTVDTGEITHVISAEEALERLEEEDFDLILLDVRMPGMGGIGMIRHLMEKGRQDLLDKIVVMSGTPGEVPSFAHQAIGGRVIGKLGGRAEICGLFLWIVDGWEVKEWEPGAEYRGLEYVRPDQGRGE